MICALVVAIVLFAMYPWRTPAESESLIPAPSTGIDNSTILEPVDSDDSMDPTATTVAPYSSAALSPSYELEQRYVPTHCSNESRLHACKTLTFPIALRYWPSWNSSLVSAAETGAEPISPPVRLWTEEWCTSYEAGVWRDESMHFAPPLVPDDSPHAPPGSLRYQFTPHIDRARHRTFRSHSFGLSKTPTMAELAARLARARTIPCTPEQLSEFGAHTPEDDGRGPAGVWFGTNFIPHPHACAGPWQRTHAHPPSNQPEGGWTGGGEGYGYGYTSESMVDWEYELDFDRFDFLTRFHAHKFLIAGDSVGRQIANTLMDVLRDLPATGDHYYHSTSRYVMTDRWDAFRVDYEATTSAGQARLRGAFRADDDIATLYFANLPFRAHTDPDPTDPPINHYVSGNQILDAARTLPPELTSASPAARFPMRPHIHVEYVLGGLPMEQFYWSRPTVLIHRLGYLSSKNLQASIGYARTAVTEYLKQQAIAVTAKLKSYYQQINSSVSEHELLKMSTREHSDSELARAGIDVVRDQILTEIAVVVSPRIWPIFTNSSLIAWFRPWLIGATPEAAADWKEISGPVRVRRMLLDIEAIQRSAGGSLVSLRPYDNQDLHYQCGWLQQHPKTPRCSDNDIKAPRTNCESRIYREMIRMLYNFLSARGRHEDGDRRYRFQPQNSLPTRRGPRGGERN